MSSYLPNALSKVDIENNDILITNNFNFKGRKLIYAENCEPKDECSPIKDEKGKILPMRGVTFKNNRFHSYRNYIEAWYFEGADGITNETVKDYFEKFENNKMEIISIF